jgi:sialate O-acetylesterase
MIGNILRIPFFLAAALAAFPAGANVTLAVPFSDHMVLQRNMPVPVWGKASAGESVAVSFRGQAKKMVAGADGNWKVTLDASEAGGPFEFSVSGDNSLVLKDVLVGEVWLAAGQSNMATSMRGIGGANLDSAKTANVPNLRVMNMQGTAKWAASTEAVILDFSATGYYFGRDLQYDLKIPVGILCNSVGNTSVESWIDPAAAAADPTLAGDAGVGNLFQTWTSRLVPFAIRGMIWYQGEANGIYTNASHPAWIVSEYQKHFQALISGHRKLWGSDFPFYYAQLPNHNSPQTQPGETSPWAELREQQRLTLALPNTAMVVLIDGDEPELIHPTHKWGVGYRLSLCARARDYGETGLAYQYPMYQSMRIDGKTVRLFFRNAEGLMAKSAAGSPGAKPSGFAIAGADNKWVWADAEIRKDTILVSAASVAAPDKVRYGWAQDPPVNIFNAAGLPASPFQTQGPQLPVALASQGRWADTREAKRLPDPARRSITGTSGPGGTFQDALGRARSSLEGLSNMLFSPP